MAMFPQFGAMPGAPAASGSAPLLSFKAGKMEVADKGGDKFHIKPDMRKGTITLFKGPDDQLMHFAWKERPSGTIVDDVIIMPEDAVYKKVDTGREGERVYLMEIAGNRRLFYWMQDKDASKDEENMKKVNELTNSPPPDDAPAARAGAGTDMMGLLSSMGGGPGGSGLGGAGGSSAGGGGGTGNEQLNIQNLQSILQNMGFSAQEQAQATGAPAPAPAPAGASSSSSSSGGGGGADSAATPAAAPSDAAAATPSASAEAPAPAAAAPAPAAAGNSGGGGSAGGGGLTAADLQRAMMNISDMMPQQREPSIYLNDVVDADAIEATGILDDPDTQRVLLPLLPEGQQTAEELRETIRSPQLQQALSSLTQALHSDNFNNIMSSFQLDPSNPGSAEAMARGDPVDAFLKALMHAAKIKKEREAAEAAAKQGGGEGGDSSKPEG